MLEPEEKKKEDIHVPVSPLVANMFMEQLERKLSATVPEDLRPKLWKRYVDDTLEVVKRGTVDKLTEFLNNLDDYGSIKFTYEVETEGQFPFLDLLLKRTNSGGLKLSVYRKPTHSDQYLNFMSHHPIDHKISVVRTLIDLPDGSRRQFISGRKVHDPWTGTKGATNSVICTTAFLARH